MLLLNLYPRGFPIVVFHHRSQCFFFSPCSPIFNFSHTWFILYCQKIAYVKPHSHCADVAMVHPDAGQPVYRDAPRHIS